MISNPTFFATAVRSWRKREKFASPDEKALVLERRDSVE